MHGLNTLHMLHQNAAAARERNARDPGHNEQRRADDELLSALDHLARAVADALDTIPAQEQQEPTAEPEGTRLTPVCNWIITRNGEDWWFLPTNAATMRTADAVFLPGTLRYGMHYIVPSPAGEAIYDSLLVASVTEPAPTNNWPEL